MFPLLLVLLATAAVRCQRQERVLRITLERDSVSALSCPLTAAERVKWTQMEGGQQGVPWGQHLIFMNVQGPEEQLYRCQQGNVSVLLNVTVTEVLSNTTDAAVYHCQHGQACAVLCSFTEEAVWPGMTLEHDLWWVEEWKGVPFEGLSPVTIGPGVSVADLVKTPSVIGCKRRYQITEVGRKMTDLPVGHTLDGPVKKTNLAITRPYSHIVRPLGNSIVDAQGGQRLEIHCDGILWDNFDEVYWLIKRCPDDKCETTFVPTEGRVTEHPTDMTLANVIGSPISTTLVLDPVEESDFQSTFYCKLDSTGVGDTVTVRLRDSNGHDRSCRSGHDRRPSSCGRWELWVTAVFLVTVTVVCVIVVFVKASKVMVW